MIVISSEVHLRLHASDPKMIKTACGLKIVRGVGLQIAATMDIDVVTCSACVGNRMRLLDSMPRH
jgi:hypothetical protein